MIEAHARSIVVALMVACSQPNPCDQPITKDDLASLLGSSLERREGYLGKDTCTVSWTKPGERAFATYEIEVERRRRPDSREPTEWKADAPDDSP